MQITCKYKHLTTKSQVFGGKKLITYSSIICNTLINYLSETHICHM